MQHQSTQLSDLFPQSTASISPPAIRAWCCTAAFALGIALGATYSDSLDLRTGIGITLAAAIASILLPRRFAPIALALALVLTGAAWSTHRLHHIPAHSLERFLSQTPTPITLEGIVVDHPTITGSQRGALAPLARFDPLATRCTIDVHTLITDQARIPVTGKLWVRINDQHHALRHSQTIRATGFARAVRPPMNPGEIDPRPLARDRNIAGSISIPNAQLVDIIEPAERTFLATAAQHILQPIHALRARTLAALQPPDAEHRPGATLLAALLLGERDTRYDDLAAPFARTGLGHLLAISGLHLGILAGTGALLIRLTGDRPRLESIAMIALALIALVLIPARTPIVRAVIILLALQPAFWSSRRHDPLALLAWAALAVLLWRPTELTNPGAQLSFAVVAALILFTRPLINALFGTPHDPDHRTTLQRTLRHAQELIAVTLVAWAASLPIVTYHFGALPIIGIPASIIMLPPIMLLLALGYGAMLLFAIFPASTHLLAPPLLTAADTIAHIVTHIDALPASSIHLPRIHPLITLLALASIASWLWRPSLKRPLPIAILVLTIAWTAWRSNTRALPDDTTLRIDTLAVGDGAVHLIRAHNQALLFDCGSTWFGAGLRTVPTALRALDAPPIRTAIISHADTDHYSALLDAARAIGLRRVLLHPAMLKQAHQQPDSITAHFIHQLHARDIAIDTIAAGDTLTIGPHTIDILWPPADIDTKLDNDASLVARITIASVDQSRTFLFTGDIDRLAMRAILDAHPLLQADVIEAPHHGSAANPDAFPFVQRLNPSVIVQSTGPSRIDDPRWADTRAGRTWLTTARDGAIAVRFLTNGDIQTRTYRSTDTLSTP